MSGNVQRYLSGSTTRIGFYSEYVQLRKSIGERAIESRVMQNLPEVPQGE